jgi:hypothetical protein
VSAIRSAADLDWEGHFSTGRTPAPDEIRDEIWRQAGVGRPPARRPQSPQYVDSPEELAELQRALGLA